MQKLIKYVLIFSLFAQVSFAISSNYYQEKFDNTKKLYLGAVMSSNKGKEIEYLKKLINYGDKLKIDTIKYKRELNRLDKTVVVSEPIKTQFVLKPKIKYTIKSVTQTKNSIIVEFNHKINSSFINFFEKKGKSFYYDYFDFKGNFKYANQLKLAIEDIDRIKIIQHKKDYLRIFLKDKENPKTIYILSGNKIIIKVLADEIKKTKVAVKPKSEVKLLPKNILYPSSKVVVIDAGHGGKDAGAVGVKNVYEKNVVLNISKYLYKELKQKGFKVYLTRDRDRFLKLSNRTNLANHKNADMFISIHANAARKSRAKEAHGVETYFLSPARSARAKRVAALENKGDMGNMGYSSKDSFLTILNQGKITASNKMAIDIQRNMLYNLRNKYKGADIRDGGVREGPFWVLVGAQMPSVLVEVGYVSHPVEGRRINTKQYQTTIAHGIANGIESYFKKN